MTENQKPACYRSNSTLQSCNTQTVPALCQLSTSIQEDKISPNSFHPSSFPSSALRIKQQDRLIQVFENTIYMFLIAHLNVLPCRSAAPSADKVHNAHQSTPLWKTSFGSICGFQPEKLKKVSEIDKDEPSALLPKASNSDVTPLSTFKSVF